MADTAPQITRATGAGEKQSPASPALVTLTREMTAGNEEAYRRFHEAYHPRLFRYLIVLTKGDEEAARETLQATLVRLVRHIRVFEAEPQFWNWLTVLARSAFADRHRKQSRYRAFLDRFQAHTEVIAPTGPCGAADNQLLAELEQSVSELPTDERDLLERKYFGGESVREIAAANQTTEKAVESRLSRARGKLKQLLLEKVKHEAAE